MSQGCAGAWEPCNNNGIVQFDIAKARVGLEYLLKLEVVGQASHDSVVHIQATDPVKLDLVFFEALAKFVNIRNNLWRILVAAKPLI